jgi:hypothetical protein
VPRASPLGLQILLNLGGNTSRITLADQVEKMTTTTLSDHSCCQVWILHRAIM